MKQYSSIANEARIKVLEMIYKGQSSHIGSNFSCIDILTVLFEKMDLEKDELVVSKGWVAASVYYFLAEKGIISYRDLDRYCEEGEQEYIGLIEPRGKFALRAAGGSMGYGLPFGVGMAMTKKLMGIEGKVYVLMSDGEMAIGTTWEAAAIAAHHNLDNLVVVVDWNGLQAMGETKDIVNMSPITNKWSIFGWNAVSLDGHYFPTLRSMIFRDRGNHKPLVVVAKTTKGKGVSFMENNNLYHYKNLTKEEYENALAELS